MDDLFSPLSCTTKYQGISKEVRIDASHSYTDVAPLPDDNLVLSTPPTDYVTIDYHYDGNNSSNVTGSLKIVVLPNEVVRQQPTSGIFPDGGVKLAVRSTFKNLYWTITQTDNNV